MNNLLRNIITLVYYKLINSSPSSECHIYASVYRVNIGSDNGLVRIRRQAII